MESTLEEIMQILSSIQNCHPSREDNIKLILCVKLLAKRIDKISENLERVESKQFNNQ